MPCFDHLACPLIDARQIDFRGELYGWRSVWVVVAAVDVHAVDAVLMDALVMAQSAGVRSMASAAIGLVVWVSYMRRTKDRAIPVGHHEVVTICKAIRTCFCT